MQSIIELSRTQDEEVGDGTTSVIILGEAFLIAQRPRIATLVRELLCDASRCDRTQQLPGLCLPGLGMPAMVLHLGWRCAWSGPI